MKTESHPNGHSLLTDRLRLSLMAALAASDKPIEFMTLLETFELTKGNLSAHLRKLEDAGLIEVEKVFVDRKSRTSYTCTNLGRNTLQEHLNELEKLIRSVKGRTA